MRAQEKAALAKLISISRAEEAILAQKSRVHWLAEGDQNSKFFHNSIKNRINRNKIVSLTMEDGNTSFDIPTIKQQVVSHFSNLLNSDPISYPGKASLATFVNKRLEPHHLECLDSEVSSEEVKNALFSIPSNKSPGSDGFNAFFFKRVWHIIGEEFVEAIKYFFSSGRLLREVNSNHYCSYSKGPKPINLK